MAENKQNKRYTENANFQKNVKNSLLSDEIQTQIRMNEWSLSS